MTVPYANAHSFSFWKKSSGSRMELVLRLSKLSLTPAWNQFHEINCYLVLSVKLISRKKLFQSRAINQLLCVILTRNPFLILARIGALRWTKNSSICLSRPKTGCLSIWCMYRSRCLASLTKSSPIMALEVDPSCFCDLVSAALGSAAGRGGKGGTISPKIC